MRLYQSSENTSTRVWEQVDALWLTRFLGLSAMAIFLPFFIHLPWLTGPLVNAILILVLLLTGFRSAILVSCLPSLMALSGGLLPAVLAPAIPFIMISNIIFVVMIDWSYQRAKTDFSGYWLGVLSGAFLKFVFLFFSVNILAAFFIKAPVLSLVVKMFGWSQLVTALAGGLIAWGVLKFLKFFK
jgi:hypothetical protein